MQYEGMSQDELVNRIKEKLDRPVMLVGMMGAGKSHVGRQLAAELGVDFIDTDKVIEEKAGASIPEIFARDGEARFREAEKNTILELVETEPAIIATGGGVVMNEDSFQTMLQNTVVIWLKADLDTLVLRTAKNKNRPLLREENPEKILGDLLAAREPFYSKSHIAVDSSEECAARATQEAIKSLYAYLNHDNLSSL